MVLGPRRGAGPARSTHRLARRESGPTPSACDHSGDDERGSQSMEFALVLPAVALVFALLLHAGGAAADLLRVEYLARDAARAAVLDLPPPSVPGATTTVRGPSRDGMVTATVHLRSGWLSRLGTDVTFTAEAAMPDEP